MNATRGVPGSVCVLLRLIMRGDGVVVIDDGRCVADEGGGICV